MSNIVVVRKRHNTYVDVKLIKSEIINKRELDILSNKIYDDFLPVVRTKKSNTELRYDVTGLVVLSEYLKKVLNKSGFIQMCLSIVDTINTTPGKTMYTKKIVMDINRIYVNPNTRQLKFLYLPITNYMVVLDLGAFFSKLPYETIYNQHEDCSYVKEYIKYFKETVTFSLFEFESMLNRMKNEEDKKPVVAHTSKVLDQNDNENTRFFSRTDKPAQSEEDEEEGTVLLGNEEGTIALSEEKCENIVYPKLKRKSTGKTIELKKSEFIIGKSKVADYTVDKNTSISRTHVKIIVRDNRYYVMDMESTNGTYIDNKRLEANIETEINPGQILKLADEEFEFGI